MEREIGKEGDKEGERGRERMCVKAPFPREYENMIDIKMTKNNYLLF